MVYLQFFGVHGSRFMVHGSRFMVHGSRFKVQGSRFFHEFFDFGFDEGVLIAEGDEGVEVVLVARLVELDGACFEPDDGSAALAVVTGIDAEVLAQLGAGPGEGLFAAVGDQFRACYAPSLADEVDDLAREGVVDVACWCHGG